MADDQTSTDAPPIPSDVQWALDETKAGLTKDEATQLDVTLAPQVADGTLNETQIYEAKLDAVAAHDHIERATEAQHEQAHNAEAGNLTGARDNASNAEWELREADNLGAGAAHPTIDAQQDQQHHETVALDSGAWEQSTAAGYQADAAAHAAVGDFDHATASADVADSHAQVATDYAAAGDHGASAAAPAAAETSGETTAE